MGAYAPICHTLHEQSGKVQVFPGTFWLGDVLIFYTTVMRMIV